MNSFLRIEGAKLTSPIIANIPHSSVHIPAAEYQSLLFSEEEARAFAAEAVDDFTETLFEGIVATGGKALVSTVSRIVVDTERYEDDTQEPQAARGLGAIYTKDYTGAALRGTVTAVERERLLNAYYRPYHQALTDLVTEALDTFGTALVLDCHSFGGGPGYDDAETPDLCLGTDSTHSPESLVSAFEASATGREFSVKRNFPYGGALLPLCYYGDTRVKAVMLEINKRCYLTETKEKSGRFVDTQAMISELCRAANLFMKGVPSA